MTGFLDSSVPELQLLLGVCMHLQCLGLLSLKHEKIFPERLPCSKVPAEIFVFLPKPDKIFGECFFPVGIFILLQQCPVEIELNALLHVDSRQLLHCL